MSFSTVTAVGKEHKDRDSESFCLFPLAVFFSFQWTNSGWSIKLCSASSGARQETNTYQKQLVGKQLSSCVCSYSRMPQCTRDAPRYATPWQPHKGQGNPTGLISLDFTWPFLVRGWPPKKSELEGENWCGGRENYSSTGTAPTDQDDPTWISQTSLHAALTAILDGLGILLLMEATWIPLANFLWDLGAFTGLTKCFWTSATKISTEHNLKYPSKYFFRNTLPKMQKNLQPSAWGKC